MTILTINFLCKFLKTRILKVPLSQLEEAWTSLPFSNYLDFSLIGRRSSSVGFISIMEFCG